MVARAYQVHHQEPMAEMLAAKKAKIRVEVEEAEITSNYEYAIKMMRWLLQIIGMWPVTSVTYPKVLRVLLIGVVWCLLIFFIIPVCLFTVVVVKDFQIRLRLAGPMSFGVMNICKYSAVSLREGRLRECIEWMASDWRSARDRAESDSMLENAKSARTFTIVCVTGVYMSCLSYATLFSFMMDPVVVNNRTSRVFAYPSYFVFFDPHAHFFKVYAFHATSCFAQCTITCSVASIAVAGVKHVCGQVAGVSRMLREVASGSFDAAACGGIVEKHLRAITFAKKLEGYMSSLCLIELMGCGFNICMLGYYFITVVYHCFLFNNVISKIEPGQTFAISYTYCILLMSFSFNIFVFCYIGDQLTGKCDVIGNIAYNVDWYHFSAKDARNLLMIIALSQRPVVLTAGKMTTLSMTCFSSVLKASFSYLNMLRTVTNS